MPCCAWARFYGYGYLVLLWIELTTTHRSPLSEKIATIWSYLVNVLFMKGAAINVKGPSGTSPLQITAPEGHLPAVKLLLNGVAQINQTGSRMGPVYLHLRPVAE